MWEHLETLFFIRLLSVVPSSSRPLFYERVTFYTLELTKHRDIDCGIVFFNSHERQSLGLC